MKRHVVKGMMACAVLLLGACCTANKSVAEQQALLRSEWKIVKVNGEQAVGEDTPSMKFTEDQVVGSTGCNRYFGGYELKGNNLLIGHVGATRRYCANAPSEAAILTAIGNVATFRVEADKAYLYDAGGTCVLELGK